MNKRILMALAAAAALSTPAWGQAPATTQPGATSAPAGPPAGRWGQRGGHGPYGPMMGEGGPGGMMGGWGGGMMGGWSGGMMGFGGWEHLPDLTSDQRGKIAAIRRELRTKQFALMDKMHDDMWNVNMYRSGKFDEPAARKAFDAMEKTRRQMFDNALDANKRIDALLTPQQRQQLERWRGG